MSSRVLPPLLCAALLAAVGPTVQAQADLSVSDAWIRYLPGDGPMAGYLVLHNSGDRPATLTDAASPAFARVMLHRTVITDGQAGMRHVDSVELPAGGELRFEPGGYHLMLMQRRGDLHIGDRVELTLRFADGSTLTAPFLLKAPYQQ